MVLPSVLSPIEKILGSSIAFHQPIAGGCTNLAACIVLNDGRKFLVKHGAQAPDAFLLEAKGLNELAQTATIRTPKVVFVDPNLLVLEWITSGRRQPLTFRQFGAGLARLHRATQSEWGFKYDNYCGQTPQKNTPLKPNSFGSWTDFYFEYRLQFQIDLAVRNGSADEHLCMLFAKLSKSRHQVLPEDHSAPSLLHGDLWRGNYLIDEHGVAVLIDPAVYYGHREADLAMTRLFGGFPDEFYSAYQDEYPLVQGWQQREPVYQLYYLLNHLNLMGGGYYGQVIAAINACLQSL